MRNRQKLVYAAAFAALFLLLILLVKKVDTAAIGPAGTAVGLSGINQAFHSLTGVHFFLYDLTEWLGVIAIWIAGCFAVMGLYQLIKRKSLMKVDREILALGGLYIAVIALYVFFEKFIVNYRPVVMPGETAPEASFPSSHTMLFCAIFGSASLVCGRYIRAFRTQRIIRLACLGLMAVTVLGRLFSGVHWLTDIVGGVLISAALLFLFSWVLDQIQPARKV